MSKDIEPTEQPEAEEGAEQVLPLQETEESDVEAHSAVSEAGSTVSLAACA
ncbi:hypothetical protein KDL01_37420 [Actinospica durhamensis]|uniref:Uncharacterized protein n=1 Tax=Actinospica durhamensis TaxID=1508375 RepID=A0A941IUF2_9ACTN|nr:hypothetical protein [Actinospica durhamensis]MBR7839007.1 hypothetical protein [Actinospica durhamensis]